MVLQAIFHLADAKLDNVSPQTDARGFVESRAQYGVGATQLCRHLMRAVDLAQICGDVGLHLGYVDRDVFHRSGNFVSIDSDCESLCEILDCVRHRRGIA